MPQTIRRQIKSTKRLYLKPMLAILGVFLLVVGLWFTFRPKPQPLGINEVTIYPTATQAVCGQVIKFLVRNQCPNTANFKTAEINCSTGGIITINSTTCAGVASLFNQAYAKCSKICLSSSPIPSPSFNPYPSPTSTVRPSLSPSPKPTSTVLPSPTTMP